MFQENVEDIVEYINSLKTNTKINISVEITKESIKNTVEVRNNNFEDTYNTLLVLRDILAHDFSLKNTLVKSPIREKGNWVGRIQNIYSNALGV